MPTEPAAKPPMRKSARRAAPARRRPETGGQPRSEETRAGLIAAALEVFGEAGFASASTRAIAKKAQVTLPVLAYHFGCKEGLYLACAQHIAARVTARMSPSIQPMLAALAQPDLPRAELVGLLLTFLNGFIDLMVGSAEPGAWIGFIIREQANPSAAFDILYSSIMSKGIGGCATLVGRLLELPPDHPQARLRALACMGQVFILRAARAASLRSLGWPDFEGEHLEAVRQAVRAQVEAIFGAP